MGGFGTSRPASVVLCVILAFLNLFAFLLAVGAERRRSTVRPGFPTPRRSLFLPPIPVPRTPLRSFLFCDLSLDAGKGGPGRVRRALLLPLRQRRLLGLRRRRLLRAPAPAGRRHRGHQVPLLRTGAGLPRLRRRLIRPLLVRALYPSPAN